jgi:hypothetical protein
MSDPLIPAARDGNQIMHERLMARAVGVARMTTHAYCEMQLSIDKKFRKLKSPRFRIDWGRKPSAMSSLTIDIYSTQLTKTWPPILRDHNEY